MPGRWCAGVRAICVMGIHYDVSKRRLSFRRLPHKAEVGGYVSYSPHPVQHSSKSALAIALAGPGANLLLALVAGTALLFLPEIGRAVQQECRDRSRMPSSA
eukprot:TRINITY_DN57846_c0_g1_i4.p1 TRINITY_DN57846_c0_g1~~TRINITY_DN57846_c0_g1_i4.p1  ORF type:complete len:102 (+),score=9.69 TRINITY_DN57846_c0_g1_i4:231-536(+)